jgi:hypothetical protein
MKPDGEKYLRQGRCKYHAKDDGRITNKSFVLSQERRNYDDGIDGFVEVG